MPNNPADNAPAPELPPTPPTDRRVEQKDGTIILSSIQGLRNSVEEYRKQAESMVMWTAVMAIATLIMAVATGIMAALTFLSRS